MNYRICMTTLAICGALAVTACSGDKSGSGDHDDRDGDKTAASGATAGATGDTITIEMHTDATGNYFKPAQIEAERGDVLRFVLVTGVHNVHFLADSNSIKVGLPPASDMLQLPGQTFDLMVSLQEGDYYFQCDPHAALGMKGKLEVEND